MADGADVVADEGKVVFGDGLIDALDELVSALAGDLAGISLLDLADGGVAGEGGDGSGSHGAAAHGLLDLLARRVEACAEVFHDVSVTGNAACARITTGDDFTEDGEVGVDAVVALCAGHADAETGDDFVTDEECAVLAAEGLDALDELFGDGTRCGLGADGLDVDSSGAAVELVEPEFLLEVLKVAGEEFLGVFEDEGRDAAGLEVAGAGDTHAPCQLIGPAVVGAAHLQDVFLAGGKTGNTDCAHAGLSTRTEHTEHVDRGNAVSDLFAELVLVLVEQTGGGAAGLQKVDDGVADDGVVGTEDGRAAGLEQVVVLVAVDVIEFRAFRFGEDQRMGIVEGKVVLDAAGDDVLRFFDHLAGLGTLLAIVLVLVLLESFGGDGVDGFLDELVELVVQCHCVGVLRDGKSGVHGSFLRLDILWGESLLTL